MEEERPANKRYLHFPSLARPLNEFLRPLRISRKEKGCKTSASKQLRPVYAYVGKGTRLRGNTLNLCEYRLSLSIGLWVTPVLFQIYTCRLQILNKSTSFIGGGRKEEMQLVVFVCNGGDGEDKEEGVPGWG